MNKKIKKLEWKADRQDQYSCCDCLLLHGITKSECENIDDLVLGILNEKMHVDLTVSDLDRNHHISQKKASSKKPRPGKDQYSNKPRSITRKRQDNINFT